VPAARNGLHGASGPAYGEDGGAGLAASFNQRIEDAGRSIGNGRKLVGDDRRRGIIHDRQEAERESLEGFDGGAVAAGRRDKKVGVDPQEHRTEIEILLPGKGGEARQIWPLGTRHTQLFTAGN
jgi:hypothetical protein